MKKRVTWLTMIIMVCLLTGCGAKEMPDYSGWLPETSYTEETEQGVQVQGVDHQSIQASGTDASYATTYYDVNTLTDALLQGESERLADYLWEDQIANGVYEVTKDDLNKNMLTFYVSSSEGDDNNMGLTPDSPKKTLEQFSGRSNITVLLKCGDVFEVEKSFSAGNGCVYATYGKGARPVVSFYQKFEVPFEKVPGYKNVWVADLMNVKGIYNGQENKDNCNIGQLVIDGEINWKRVVVSTEESTEFDFAQSIEGGEECSWTVDWIQSKLYIHSKKNPNKQEIYVAPDVHGIVVDGKMDVTLKGWEVRGAGAHGCNIMNSIAVSVSNCFFYNIGGSVHRSAGIRYGNAVQVWNSGKDIWIAYNYADWVFDSCYTNQGSSAETLCENIIFERNIGAHSFTGIETWADSYSAVPGKNIVYRDNLIYEMCDITDPEQKLYGDKRGKLLLTDEELTEYITYRGGYTYNQMCCLNITSPVEPGGLTVEDNVFWETNRLLVLVGDTGENLTHVVNNFFHADVPTTDVYLYRQKNELNEIIYKWRLMIPSNEESVRIAGNGKTEEENKVYLEKVMRKIVSE